MEDIQHYPLMLNWSLEPDILASTTQSYVQKLQNRLQWAYKTAQEVNKKECGRSKRCLDNKIRWVKLEPEDMILVCQKAFKGKHKIQDRWETFPKRSLNVSDLISPFIKCRGRERGSKQEFSTEICCSPLFVVIWVSIIMINNRTWMIKM